MITTYCGLVCSTAPTGYYRNTIFDYSLHGTSPSPFTSTAHHFRLQQVTSLDVIFVYILIMDCWPGRAGPQNGLEIVGRAENFRPVHISNHRVLMPCTRMLTNARRLKCSVNPTDVCATFGFKQFHIAAVTDYIIVIIYYNLYMYFIDNVLTLSELCYFSKENYKLTFFSVMAILTLNSSKITSRVSYLVFNVPFQHKYMAISGTKGQG